MDISEVAKRTGVSPSALRYYEKRGLITSVGRSGARRIFAPDVQERLALIALGQSAGLSLDEIAQMLLSDGRPRVDRALLSRRADELDARIHQLTAMRDGLRHAADCSAEDHMECPKFLRLLGIEASRRAGQRRQPRNLPVSQNEGLRRSLDGVLPMLADSVVEDVPDYAPQKGANSP